MHNFIFLCKMIFALSLLGCNSNSQNRNNYKCNYTFEDYKKNKETNHAIKVNNKTEAYIDERENGKGNLYVFNQDGTLKSFKYYVSDTLFRYSENYKDGKLVSKMGSPMVFYFYEFSKGGTDLYIYFSLLNKSISNIYIRKDNKEKEIQITKNDKFSNLFYSGIHLDGLDKNNIKKIKLLLSADIKYCDGTIEQINEELKYE